MNRITLSAWLALLFGFTACGQTNCAEACHGLFLVPGCRLREQQSDAQSPSRPAPVDPIVSAGRAAPDADPGAMAERLKVVRMALSSGIDRFDPDLFHKLEQDGCFVPAPERPTGLAKFADSVFRPEVISIGKTKLTCSLITAIKRKNPLCLINPCVLNFSW